VAVNLSREEAALIKELSDSGDVNRSEVIRSARALNEAEAKLINRKNKYLEDARSELIRADDEIAQNIQVLAQRKQQLADSVFTALVPGIVKNVRVTTLGGVLRAGEELMQIIPIGDELILEAKISPQDIAQVKKGLEATIRFDPFDYTIYGGVIGKVVYVSPDTLKEESNRGEEIYYRVHISTLTNPVTTTSGRQLAIQPGMTAQVDIKTSDRTVLNYLLKPLRKTLAESFGER
jgi:adhesin transport system membrane fusion protein